MYPYSWHITNDGEAEAEYVIAVSYPVGSMENPQAIDYFEAKTASIKAGDQDGYYFIYTADCTGKDANGMIFENKSPFNATVSISADRTGISVTNFNYSGGTKIALDILYETVSATATVGLSRALTPTLNVVGRLIITATMYLGRVGPISLAVAFAFKKDTDNNIKMPTEDVRVG